MSDSHVEVERAFSPRPDSELPDLAALEAVSVVEPAGEDELDATYYDVPGLVLLRAGVTLRRRTGGPDQGWHLKLPGTEPSATLELQARLGRGRDRPPARLNDLVAGWTRGGGTGPGRPDPHPAPYVSAGGSRRVGARRVCGAVLADPCEGGPGGRGSPVGSQRYFALRTALDDLAADPPWTPTAEKPARDVLPRLVRKEGKRVRRRRRAEDPHELRKAVKRLRFAYELVEPVWGKKARRPRKAAHELSRVLGDRQDSLVSREWLADLSSDATCLSAGAFVFGRLHTLEEQHEAEYLEQAEPAWDELKSVMW